MGTSTDIGHSLLMYLSMIRLVFGTVASAARVRDDVSKANNKMYPDDINPESNRL